jgi:glycosyltransferase involved in cell wall biosynthesis
MPSSLGHPPTPLRIPTAESDQSVDFVTVVVPCFNESKCLPVLVQRVEAALTRVRNLEYELLIVDDGSKDNTTAVLQGEQSRNSRIGILQFVRNFGHQAALSAGLEHAKGDAVIVMDADLQHPPELLPEMIARWREGSDIVQTIRRAQPGLGKSVSSRLFYWLLNRVAEIEVVDGAADFRLMSRRAVDSLLALPERCRFLRGLVAWLGFPCTTISFDVPPRYSGRSGYSLRKMFQLAAEAVVTLSTRPLHFALYVGGATILAALAYGAFALVMVTRGVAVRGWASTIFVILIMGSVNLVCTGILGLYLRAVLSEIRRRPAYLVSAYSPAKPKNATYKASAAAQYL